MRERVFPISFAVIIRTMGLFTGVTMKTLFDLEVIRMEFLFLPPVAERALVLKGAPIFVRSNEAFGVPVLAHLLLVVKDRRLSSVVLPVVSVHTDISFMIVFPIGTPHCLEME